MKDGKKNNGGASSQTPVEEVSADQKPTSAPSFVELIYWRDLKKSGIVFGSLLVLLLSLALFSVLSVVAYLSLAVLTVTSTFVVYRKVIGAVQKQGDSHPFNFMERLQRANESRAPRSWLIENQRTPPEPSAPSSSPDPGSLTPDQLIPPGHFMRYHPFKSLLEYDVTLPEERLHEVADAVMKSSTNTLKELRRLFLVEDLVDSLKFGLVLWVLTYFGAWFNGMTLIILIVIGVFTIPKFYETYKAQIDQYLDLAKTQVSNVIKQVKEKIPIGKKKKEE